MGWQKPVITGKVDALRRSDFTIEKIVQYRKEATQSGIIAVIFFELLLQVSYSTYSRISLHQYFAAVVPGIGVLLFALGLLVTTVTSRMFFLTAYRSFYLRRYVEALDVLKAEGYNWERITDKNALQYWEFYWTKDLKQFEQALFDYLRSFRRAEDLLQRQAKWAMANAKLTKQLEVVLDDFHITGTERQEVLDDFASHDNPQRRKEFLASYRSRIAHERWLALNSALHGVSGVHQLTQHPAGSEEDFRLTHLEREASMVTSDSAYQYYREALTTDARREKIRLFKRALSEDIRSAETEGEVLAAIATKSKAPSKAITNEVRYLSLQDFARERLIKLGQFAVETEWQMCREIILALARPGQSGGRFNKHYFAEDTVKRMVRRQCNMYGDILFRSGTFDEAAAWLLRNGVLVTKPKVDERTLSLSTNVKNATQQGAEIISMILRLKREMSGLPS